MNVALVKDAENDVHGGQGRDDQNEHGRLRILKGLGRTLEAPMNGGRHAEFALKALDAGDGIAEGSSRPKVERKSDRRIKALVIDGERGVRVFVVGNGTEWNNPT